MPNTIALAKNYVPLLDEVYQRESVTSDLTGDPAMARAGANAKEIVYPHIAVTGLGDYDRNSGYTQGTVDFNWESTKYNYDRGAKLAVDGMDNQETYNLAFGMADAELMRTKVAPEAGHYRKGTAKYAKTTDEEVVSSKTYYTESGGVYSKVENPQSSAIGNYYELVQEAAKPINFMIIHKPAIIKHDKHVVSNVIPAASNPDADADIIKYRKYGLVDLYKNKVAGIYLSHQA